MKLKLGEMPAWLFELPILSPAFLGISLFFLSTGSFFFISSDNRLKQSVLLQFIALIAGVALAFSLSSRFSLLRAFNSSPSLLNRYIQPRDRSRFYFVIYLLQFVQCIDFLFNTNFSSSSSSARFAAVQLPFLHSMALYLATISPFLLLLAPMKSWKSLFLSPPWIISNIISFLGLSAAASKGALFVLLTQYIVVLGLRFSPSLNISLSSIFSVVLRFRLKLRLLLFLPLLTAFIVASLFYASHSANGFDALLFRLFNGFDQLALINPSTVDIVSSGDAPAYPFVWFKSFLRPLFPWIYDPRFDNYTEQLIYCVHGKLTLAYADTGWAPNNLLFVDSILNFPSSLLLQFLNTFTVAFLYVSVVLRLFAFFLSAPFFSSIRSAASLAPAATFYFSPLGFAQDTQYLASSLLFSIMFLVSLSVLLKSVSPRLLR